MPRATERVDKRLPFCVLPVGLVERRVGHRTLASLRQVVAGVPEVLGERVGEVVALVPVRARVDLLDVHLDARALGLLGRVAEGTLLRVFFQDQVERG